MSHLYPLAVSAAEALASPEPAARTRYDAEALADGQAITGLETEWLTPDETEAAALETAADAALGAGFVQRYEDAAGAPVYAVTYWKLAPGPAKKPAPPPETPTEQDHTDELYFRRRPARRRRKTRKPDPRQLDLFAQGPDQKGYEYPDPSNPDVILAEEEGDGTAFGLAPKKTGAQR